MRISRWVGLSALLVLVASPALAGSDIHIDFDKDFDFSAVKTYAWQVDPKASLVEDNPFFHQRIMECVDGRLYRAGNEKVASNPDVYIGYRVSTTTDLSLDSTYFGYYYPTGWFWDPYWASIWATPNMPSGGRTYTHGTLLLEVWTAKTKQIVWRGSGTIGVSSNYDKMSDKIFKVVGQMADRWHDMHERQEKEKAKAAASR